MLRMIWVRPYQRTCRKNKNYEDEIKENNVEKFESVAEDDPIFDMGISSLHLGPRMFEMVVKMSARRNAKVYHKSKHTEVEIEAEKKRICDELYTETGRQAFKILPNKANCFCAPFEFY